MFIEPLDRRVMLAVTAMFAGGGGGDLRVTGDEQDNVITISRTAGGTILVNNGAVTIAGGTPTVANTGHFHIVGAGGNDNISLDESNGALPGAALFGGAGNDTLVGGSGDDFADGDTGSDTVFLGAGDDTFQWNPGNGSDVVEGQGGRDTIVFNGADVAEKFEIADSGNGLPFHRVRLTRDIGNVAMDLNGLEEIDLNANGGADTITVNDQTATDVFTVNLDLGGSGFGDGQVDAIILNGTEGDDAGQIADFGTFIGANVGLFPFVNITSSEGTNDTLTVNALGGNDEVDASSLPAGLIKLSVNGGAGNDTVRGSLGNDTFVWNAGDGNDSVDGQAGADTLRFIGSAGADAVVYNSGSFSAGGFTVTLTNVETRTFDGNGGGDSLTINAGAVALASTQKLASLSISAGGMLDIRDHGLILDYSGNSSPIGSFTASGYTGVTGLIQRGAIVSSSDTSAVTGIGVAEASDAAPGYTFDGISVDATAVLVKFTYAGDANLDGKINIDDYGHIDTSIGVGRTGWFNGDFNYDGQINIDDYGIIDVNIGTQGPPLAPTPAPPTASGAAPQVRPTDFAAVTWGAFDPLDDRVVSELFPPV
jgi:hypothetical protein